MEQPSLKPLSPVVKQPRLQDLLALGVDESRLTALSGEDEVTAATVADHFPEIELLGIAGRGGFGVVWRGEHRHLRRSVALKILSGAAARQAQARARFQREMEVAGALDDPGIVRTFDAGERGELAYIVMEWLDGADFALLAAKGQLEVGEACELIRQAALALGHAHERGLIHRDIKLGNLMLARTPDGPRVKVLDFGTARLAERGLGPEELTATGEFLGTFAYAAPEMVDQPEAVGPPSDVFGLGAVLYHLLAGVPPRREQEATSLLARIQSLAWEAIPSLAAKRPDLPEGLIRLVDEMLAVNPGARPAHCLELAQRLTPFAVAENLARLLDPFPPSTKFYNHTAKPPRQASYSPAAVPARRRRWWILGVSAAVIISTAVAFYYGANRTTPPPAASSGVPASSLPPALAALKLPEADLPRLLDNEWEYSFARPISVGVRSAHYNVNGEYIFFCSSSGAIYRSTVADGKLGRPLVQANAQCIATSGATRSLAWSSPQGGGSLGRTRDTSSFALSPLLKILAPGVPSRPLGLTFLRKYWSGKGPELRGDYLVVDAGPGETKGVWRFRPDSDEPPQQVVRNRELLESPVDIGSTMHAAYIANPVLLKSGNAEAQPSDYRGRILKLQLGVLAPCTTNRPIVDPCALDSEVTTGDLYVACGNQLAGNRAAQQVLRLVAVLGRNDSFVVHPIISHLQRISIAGVDVTDGGKRILISDEGAGILYELRRKNAPAPSPPSAP